MLWRRIPGGTRTHNPQIKSLPLYTIELPEHVPLFHVLREAWGVPDLDTSAPEAGIEPAGGLINSQMTLPTVTLPEYS